MHPHTHLRTQRVQLTSKCKYGAIFYLHKGVKRPSAAHHCIRIRGICGGRDSGGLWVNRGRLGHLHIRRALLHQVWGFGHFQSDCCLLVRLQFEIGGRQLCGLHPSAVGRRRGGSGRLKQLALVVILCHHKRVSARWRERRYQ